MIDDIAKMNTLPSHSRIINICLRIYAFVNV